jgi:xylulokinase
LRLADRARCPLFLPYLSGERSPHNNPNAQGALFGLTHAHGPAEIAYAVVEGVSFGLRDGFDTLRLPADMPLREVALVGGGARSVWWGQLLADIFQVPLTLYAGSETGGALGAARLAWLADGGSVAEVCTLPPVKQKLTPSPEGAAVHKARHARFQVLYMALRDQFR